MTLDGRQHYIFILVILLLTTCKPTKENGIIENGIYEVKFNSDFNGNPSVYEDYKLTIDGADYTKQFKNELTEKGKIEKLYADMFRLVDSNEKDVSQDSLTDLQKSFQHWGPPYFELTGRTEDTLEFRTTFRGQLHVNLNTGLLIKEK
jgi:hypothetical protein